MHDGVHIRDGLGYLGASAEVALDPLDVGTLTRPLGQDPHPVPRAFSKRTMLPPRCPVPPVTSTVSRCFAPSFAGRARNTSAGQDEQDST
jgi:hypothetical protein